MELAATVTLKHVDTCVLQHEASVVASNPSAATPFVSKPQEACGCSQALQGLQSMPPCTSCGLIQAAMPNGSATWLKLTLLQLRSYQPGRCK